MSARPSSSTRKSAYARGTTVWKKSIQSWKSPGAVRLYQADAESMSFGYAAVGDAAVAQTDCPWSKVVGGLALGRAMRVKDLERGTAHLEPPGIPGRFSLTFLWTMRFCGKHSREASEPAETARFCVPRAAVLLQRCSRTRPGLGPPGPPCSCLTMLGQAMATAHECTIDPGLVAYAVALAAQNRRCDYRCLTAMPCPSRWSANHKGVPLFCCREGLYVAL